ncbi:MAG: prepilin-type N-terminal cleavage/methylation domain-containing protein [Chitinivibrionales bacterium]|nr:prepilin-type N-terminal cleavage/methylation domain-containing protein [Chitinivibrionales bacterium]
MRYSDKGFTLIELMVTIVIATIVGLALTNLYRGFAEQNKQQRRIAEVRSQLTRVSELIERDIRMAGYGLAGTGIRPTLGDPDDEILIFRDDSKGETALASAPASGGTCIHVEDPASITSDQWLCLMGADTLYRQVADIALSLTSCNIPVTEPLPAGHGFAIGDKVLLVTGIQYSIGTDGGVNSLIRNQNGKEIEIPSISILEIAIKNSEGNEITANFENARSLFFRVGGVPSGSTTSETVETTIEANPRNYH